MHLILTTVPMLDADSIPCTEKETKAQRGRLVGPEPQASWFQRLWVELSQNVLEDVGES